MSNSDTAVPLVNYVHVFLIKSALIFRSIHRGTDAVTIYRVLCLSVFGQGWQHILNNPNRFLFALAGVISIQ